MPQNSSININFNANLGNLGSVLNQAQQRFQQIRQSAAQAAQSFQQFNRAANSTSGYTSATRAATASTSGLGGAIRNLTSRFGSHNAAINMSANAYKGLVGQVASLNRFMNASFAAIRQVGQGLQNFGTVFSIFISAPVGLIFRNLIGEMLDFDDTLIEVRKTTGLTTEDVKMLGDQLTTLSTQTPTARDALATMAADWGRMGAQGIDTIMELTRQSDMLAIATTLTADEIVTAIGRIGNIYYRDLDELALNFESLASAINELGQANPFDESELVSAFLRFAPQAKAIGLTIQEALGLSATAIGTNVSAERAGTQLATSVRMMAVNYEDVAAASGKYTDEIKEFIDANPVGVYLGIVDGLNDIESETERTIVAQEIFGAVGGKAALSIAANTELAATNIAIANRAYEEGVSVFLEFQRSLDSVRNQLSILRNNIIAMASEIGEVLLPIITDFVALAVPAVQMLTEQFSMLTERTKITIVGIGLLVTALGPLLIMIGTLMFSIGIIGTGLSTMVATLLSAAFHIGRFVGIILGVLAPFRLVAIGVAAVASAAVYLYRTLEDTGNAIGTFSRNAVEWGYNLFSSFAEGITQATSIVYQAVMGIINSFIGLIQAFSPPKEGPLKDIDKWGESTIEAYVEGMTRADVTTAARGMAFKLADSLRSGLSSLNTDSMDLFSSIFGQMKSAINALGSYLDEEIRTGAISEWMERAGNALIDFLNAAETGGGSLSGISDILGSLTGDFERLVRLQNDYVSATERLEDVKDALEGLDDATSDQLEAVMERTDLTLDQRISLMRKIRLDAAERRKQLEDDEKNAEKEKEAAQDRVDAQKQLVQAITSLVDSNSAKKPKAPEEEDLITNSLLGATIPSDLEPNMDRLDEIFKDTTDTIEGFSMKLSRAQEIMRGFFAGLRGEVYNTELQAIMGEDFSTGYVSGRKIYESLGEISGAIDKYLVQPVTKGIDEVQKAFGILGQGITDGFLGEVDFEGLTRFQQIIYGIGAALGYIVSVGDAAIDKVIEIMGAVYENRESQNPFQPFIDGWRKAIDQFDPDGSLMPKLDLLGQAVGAWIALFLLQLGWIVGALAGTMGWIGGLIGKIIDWSLNVVMLSGAVSEFFLSLARLSDNSSTAEFLFSINEGFRKFGDTFRAVWQFINDAFIPLTDAIVDLEDVFVTFAVDLVTLLGGALSFLWYWVDEFAKALGAEDGLGSALVGILDFILGTFVNFVKYLAQSMEIVLRLVTAGVTAMGLLNPTLKGEERSRRKGIISEQRNKIMGILTGERNEDTPDVLGSTLGNLPSGMGETIANQGGPLWDAEDLRFDEDLLDMIGSDAGNILGAELSSSFADYMSSTTAESDMVNSVKNVKERLRASTEVEFTETGTAYGSNTIAGFVEYMELPEAEEGVDSTRKMIESWATSNQRNFQTTGIGIGGNIIDGLKDATGPSELAAITSAFDKWINDNETITAIQEIGEKFGGNIVDGIIAVLQLRRDEIDGELASDTTPSTPSPTPSVGPSSIDPYAGSLSPGMLGAADYTTTNNVQSPIYNINVTVDSASIQDQRNANNLAKEIERKIDRDLRYSRVSS